MGGTGSGGRNAKPTRLHVLRGSYRRDRHGQAPQAPPLVDPPKPPDWLPADGRLEWDRVAPRLVTLGLLTDLDVMALTAYCAAVATWRAASQQVAVEGVTVPTGRGDGVTTHPAVRTAQRAELAMLRWSAELGLTPASRGRLGVAAPEPGSDLLTRYLSPA